MRLVLSTESAGEAAVVEDIQVIAVDSLAQAVAFFAGQIDIDDIPRRNSGNGKSEGKTDSTA